MTWVYVSLDIYGSDSVTRAVVNNAVFFAGLALMEGLGPGFYGSLVGPLPVGMQIGYTLSWEGI